MAPSSPRRERQRGFPVSSRSRRDQTPGTGRDPGSDPAPGRTPIDVPGTLPGAAAAPPSLRKNFAARLAADAYVLVTALVAATITARVLGPSGRGYYASLTLLSVLFAQIFDAGLGEASIVLPGRTRASRETAVSATVAVLIPLGVVGAAVCMLTGVVTLHVVTANDRLALALAGVLLPLNLCSSTLAWFLVSRERLVLVALVTALSSTVITVSIYIAVAVVHMGVAGAMLGSVLGAAAVIVPLGRALRQEAISIRPVWNGSYLRSAVAFGMMVQVSNLLVQVTARLDLLFVYRIAGAASAGMYSVALTIGALVGSVPIAVAYTAFPRLPKLDAPDAHALIAGLFRAGVSASLVCAVTLAAITPVVIPFVFGPAYTGAVLPTLILIPSGVFWSGQWILCRSVASRQVAKPLVVSFASSFAIMVLLDLAVIGRYGAAGAGAASLLASAAGFAIAVRYYLLSGSPWRALVPHLADLGLMSTMVRQMLGSLRGRGSSPS